MRRIVDVRLIGKLYKLWIAGGAGFRYTYFFDPGKLVVIPIFLSLVRRDDFDWDTAPFQEIGEAIVEDFLAGRWGNFIEPRLV